MASYLVTGGAGFIGSHLTEELVRRGHQVRVVDNLITGHRRNLDHIPGVEFLEGDLADAAVARRAVEGMEYVLPGGDSVRAEVGEGSRHLEQRQHHGVAQHLVAARGRPRQALVYAGSSSVRRHADAPETRGHAAWPLSPYALQKLVAEQYCQLFTRLYGFETVTTRHFNVFGPRRSRFAIRA